MDPALRPWLERLREVPFVRKVEARGDHGDLRVIIHTPKGPRRYRGAIRTAKLGYPALAPLVARAGDDRWLLLATHVAPPMASHLRAAHIDFIDQAGNCYLDLDGAYVASIEGRRPVPDRRHDVQGRGAAGQVFFALSADATLVTKPVREIAQRAGAGKSATAEALRRLVDEGIVGETRATRRVLRPDRLLERWLGAYPDLRRNWLQGRYRPQETDQAALEQRLAEILPASWAWGGTAAAARMTRYYRGPETVVHVPAVVADLPRRLKAVPATDGLLTILVTPPPIAYEGVGPHVAHPLLVYTELAGSDDERARDAAARVREKFLPEPR